LGPRVAAAQDGHHECVASIMKAKRPVDGFVPPNGVAKQGERPYIAAFMPPSPASASTDETRVEPPLWPTLKRFCRSSGRRASRR
jgi:hypothetical protein